MPRVRLILPTCLFLSGLCALAYQVTWARYLQLFLGATAPAYTIVLATFMGGLAGGAYFFGRRADRTDRPLRMYARLEILVATVCFAFPWLLDALGQVYLILAAPLIDQPLPRNTLRFFMAVTVLAVPSFLMGGTLPAATRFYVRAIDQIGEGVGRLYFVNALGAVVGALLAGIFLIPAMGLHATLWLAAAINLGIGLWALMVSRKIDGASACPAGGWEAELEDLEEPAPKESPFPMWVALIALSATAASGAASMIYEVAWIRLLTLILGGSTYAFTIMVAAFILGIAIGSALVAWWKPLSKGGLAAFGYLEVGVAFVVLAMVPVYNRLSYYYLEIGSKISREESNYGLYLFVGFMLCFVVMMVPTILLGATFPLAARLSTRSIDTLGGGVGRAYAFDTGGTIVGTIVAGHFLFPWIGLHGTFAFAAALNMAAGAACLAGAGRLAGDRGPAPVGPRPLIRRPSVIYAGAMVLSAAFVVLAMYGPRMDRMIQARGMFRQRSGGFDDFAQFRAWLAGGIDLLHYRDGPEGSVSILEVRGQMVLNVNGKPEASSEGDMPTQLCVAHLPMMLHPSPERAVLIGLGGGATAGALLTHTEVETTVVELSPQVVEANRLFAPFNRGVVENPRLDLVVEDAKAYMGLTGERFDVIVSQPSNPWVAGNANLFTYDFFDLLRQRLAPGGMMVQWFHDYEMTDDAVRTILHTFSSAFPETRLFHCGNGRDYVLIGSEEPIGADLSRIKTLLATNDEVRNDVKRYLGIRSPIGVLVRNVLDDAGVRATGEGGRLHRDHRPVLDFQAPKGVFLGSMSQLITTADQRWDPVEENDLLIYRITDRGDFGTDDAFEEAVGGVMAPFGPLRRAMLSRWVESTGSVAAKRSLAKDLGWIGLDTEALDLWREIEETGQATLDDRLQRWNLEALIAYQNRKDSRVEAAFVSMGALAEEMKGPFGFDVLADMAELLDHHDVAREAWRSALDRTGDAVKWDRIERLIGLARASRRTGDFEEGAAALAEASQLRPDHWSLLLELERFESTGGDAYLTQ